MIKPEPVTGTGDTHLMRKVANYDAFWVPGLGDELDQNASLKLGFDWLRQAERDHGGSGVIVMYAKSMAGNSPMGGRAASRWEFVSPRSQRPSGRGPVLCIWPPDDRVLEFAEDLAFGSALCVIRAYVYDIAAWIERTGARPLAQGYDEEEKPSLPEEITRLLDSSLFFGGSNGFVGGGEKEISSRGCGRLRHALTALERRR